MSEWKRIDSAPRDGEHIILCDADTQWVGQGYYSEDGHGWFEQNTHYTDATDGEVRPSYWMPLPLPERAGA